AKAGAIIETDVKRLWTEADIVLKVKEPMFNSALQQDEADLIRAGATLITFLHPATPANHPMVEKLRARNVTALTMDGIPRISRAQRMDALTSMSTLTGYKAVVTAAARLPVVLPMVGTAIGAIKPAVVMVVGGGVVGLQAIATAKRLGAVVMAVDIRDQAREACASLGAKVEGFEVPAEMAQSADGYACRLPDDWLEKEAAALAPLAAKADAVILSALVPGEIAPVLITAETVRKMRPGAVIVDVAIDQGGNCALTKPGALHTVDDVLICGTKNIPGSVPVHATWLYANNMYYFVENLFKKKAGEIDFDDEIVRSATVTRDGRIVHAGTLKAMGKES
ncbi:MAG: NAD(P)(+) transhydrogenase (Re/Si-specific) subunit alpha, partial [Desulfobacteraceae bacterium]|nr:NAD(P)(+) transhydrogenase (Re/Si-specific) subunit alpha [Desulfobacteraceae bacterium]